MHLTLSEKSLDLQLILSSPEVVSYISSIPESLRIQECIRIFEIGCLVLSKVDTHKEFDYLNNRVNHILSQVNDKFSFLDSFISKTLRESLDPTVSGNPLNKANELLISNSAIATAKLDEVIKFSHSWLARELEKLQLQCNSLDKAMDPTNKAGHISQLLTCISEFDKNLATQFSEYNTESLLNKIQKAVSQYLGNDSPLTKSIEAKLSLDAASPLGQYLSTLKAEITLLRDAVMTLKGEKEISENTTIKGFDFEPVVFGVLQEIARPYGDVIEDVSKTAEAISLSKKGDFIYTLLDSNSKVVLDAKNYKKLTSLKVMLDYLREAMHERDSLIGIIVAPDSDSLQKQIGSWNIYEGNKIITSLENLEITIKFCKHYLRFKSAENSSEFNAALFKEKLEILQRKIKEISNVKTKLSKLSTGVTSSISEIQTLLDQLKDDLAVSLVEFEKILEQPSESAKCYYEKVLEQPSESAKCY